MRLPYQKAAPLCVVYIHMITEKVKAKTNMNYDVVRNTEETCASIVVIQLFAWKKGLALRDRRRSALLDGTGQQLRISVVQTEPLQLRGH